MPSSSSWTRPDARRREPPPLRGRRGEREHERAAVWLHDVLRGDRRVGIPWQTIGAFLRIATHPRVTRNPLTGPAAWSLVQRWLDAPPTWVPPATERTAAVLRRLIQDVPVTGNLLPDAPFAALAIEHGVVVMTADTDFGRFPDLRWTNPLRAYRSALEGRAVGSPGLAVTDLARQLPASSTGPAPSGDPSR